MLNLVRKWYVKMYVRKCELGKGQSMTEYALILAAVAVAVYATYSTLGTNITSKVNAVNSALTAS